MEAYWVSLQLSLIFANFHGKCHSQSDTLVISLCDYHNYYVAFDEI